MLTVELHCRDDLMSKCFAARWHRCNGVIKCIPTIELDCEVRDKRCLWSELAEKKRRGVHRFTSQGWMGQLDCRSSCQLKFLSWIFIYKINDLPDIACIPYRIQTNTHSATDILIWDGRPFGASFQISDTITERGRQKKSSCSREQRRVSRSHAAPHERKASTVDELKSIDISLMTLQFDSTFIY
jgi:hypothetical protein